MKEKKRDIISAKTQELRKKQKEVKQLMDGLDRAIALERLWPEVFEGSAKPSSHWRGIAPSTMALKMGAPKHAEHTFVVTSAAGETREFPFEMVPDALGGGLE